MTFVNLTIDAFRNLDFKDPNKLYFVSTNNAFGYGSENSAAAPTLLFIGDTLIGNSSTLTRHSTNGFISNSVSHLGDMVEVLYENATNIKYIKLSNNNLMPGTIKIYDTSKGLDELLFVDDTSNYGTSPSGGTSFLVSNDDRRLVVGFIDYGTGKIVFNDDIINNRSFTNNNIDYRSSDVLHKYGNIDLLKFEYNDEISIVNADVLSKNIPGVLGQTLFVIDEHKLDNDIDSINTSTYMYYWYQPDNNGNGQWKNSNLNYTSQLTIGDRTVSSQELERLLDLLY